MPKTLAQQVAERKKFLETVAKFVASMCFARGTKISYEECSTHTRGEYRLDNFAGFSFWYDWGWSGHYKIIYHGKSEEFTALNFTINVGGKCEVTSFSDKPAWLPALKNLMRNTKKIISDMEKKEKVSSQLLRKKEMEKEKEIKLKEEATKLGL